MRHWEYIAPNGVRATLDQRALLCLLVDGRLPIETPVRRRGSRWRTAGRVRAFEPALYPPGMHGPLPAFDAPGAKPAKDSYPAARPWVRLWARALDLAMFSAVLHVILGALGWTPGTLGESAIGLATPLAWVVVEALFMAITGTTPGKALLRVRVRRREGGRIGFEAALTRAMDVWIRGLALGIPVVMVVTEVLAYRGLARDGVTSWDLAGDLVVSHDVIGPRRIAGAVVIVLALSILGAR